MAVNKKSGGIGKVVAFAAAAGAVAAGISYFTKYKSFHKELEEDFHDFEDDSDISAIDSTMNRSYVALHADKDEFKVAAADMADAAKDAAEAAKNMVKDAASIVADNAHSAATAAADTAQSVLETAKEKLEAVKSAAKDSDPDQLPTPEADGKAPAGEPEKEAPTFQDTTVIVEDTEE